MYIWEKECKLNKSRNIKRTLIILLSSRLSSNLDFLEASSVFSNSISTVDAPVMLPKMKAWQLTQIALGLVKHSKIEDTEYFNVAS